VSIILLNHINFLPNTIKSLYTIAATTVNFITTLELFLQYNEAVTSTLCTVGTICFNLRHFFVNLLALIFKAKNIVHINYMDNCIRWSIPSVSNTARWSVGNMCQYLIFLFPWIHWTNIPRYTSTSTLIWSYGLERIAEETPATNRSPSFHWSLSLKPNRLSIGSGTRWSFLSRIL
jgi:hypothetical protein